MYSLLRILTEKYICAFMLPWIPVLISFFLLNAMANESISSQNKYRLFTLICHFIFIWKLIFLLLLLLIYKFVNVFSITFVGFVTDHINLLQDHSKLYHYLAVFEEDAKRKIAMENRRIQFLQPLLTSLNRTAFDNLHKQVSNNSWFHLFWFILICKSWYVAVYFQLFFLFQGCTVLHHKNSSNLILFLSYIYCLFYLYLLIPNLSFYFLCFSYFIYVNYSTYLFNLWI